MAVGEICSREVVFGRRHDSIQEIAQLMRENHVGDLIIVDEEEGQRTPVGIITDRDIVIGVIAEGVGPQEVLAEELMSTPLTTVTDDTGVYETIQVMRGKAIRRVPVVNHEGELLGIASLDDLLELLAEEISALAKISRKEEARERHLRIKHTA